MATNWTLAQATKEILAGNKEATIDIGRRFPLTAVAIAAMGNNEGAITIINALPEHITARKIESVLKDGVTEMAEDDVEETEVAEEKPVKEEKKAAAKKEKVEKKPAKKVKEEVVEEESDDEESKDYSEMTAMELFKLCKSRKIKVEPKQKAAVYIKALKAADDDADDDWEEEEEETPAPKKKPAKKPAAKVEKEEDEDDDWDI